MIARVQVEDGANVELFTSLRRTHLWSTAVEQIKELIATGRLTPGTRLPGERELCQQLGISRVSLREAIRVLEHSGHLEVKPGRGTFVRDSSLPSSERLSTWLRGHNDLVHQLFEVRELVEPGLAAIAARRRDPVTINALFDSINEQVSALNHDDFSTGIAADRRFHQILARATGNAIVNELTRQMIQIIGEEQRASLQIPGQLERAIAGHRAIANAIRGGDETGASAAMRQHLRDATR
jgi:GntR family transcriptional repressor for pyruvate dehydrogenase complex